MVEEIFRHIVRIANTDLVGEKPVYMALRKIKGISFMYSNLVCQLSGIDRSAKIGSLPESEVSKIKDVIDHPQNYKIPTWMMNRRKDWEDGTDKHIFDADLVYTIDNDLKRLKKIKSYKGLRHAFGLPVRGQRTKSKHRKNKGKALGVKKKKGAKSGKV
jgi:small subunit ribosomal protein S13